jgi:hypothetical protein
MVRYRSLASSCVRDPADGPLYAAAFSVGIFDSKIGDTVAETQAAPSQIFNTPAATARNQIGTAEFV